MHPFSTPRKHQKTLGFQGVDKGCTGNEWVKNTLLLNRKNYLFLTRQVRVTQSIEGISLDHKIPKQLSKN